MQTCRQSRLKVGADFGVSLVVNLGPAVCSAPSVRSPVAPAGKAAALWPALVF